MDDDSKLSVNKMVEFAMGLSMASLFTKAMETAYNNTRWRDSDLMQAPAKYVYAIVGGVQKGPFSLGEVMQMIKSGDITPETYMWKPGMPEWKLAKDITDIAPGLEFMPPQSPKTDV